ncbi:MAG: tRNA 2-thiouridine(34) synthase MnmA [Coriobacteriales bacterium]|jgi:tRNA-specific 2-thiouridylase|nr:tRNA 2-thiouridine(34) synthase MnmA [Coriobacteriales bacterium]
MKELTNQRSAKPRALIAMSGGVDSSVSALLMHQAGYDCAGVTMRLIDDSYLEPSSDLNHSINSDSACQVVRQGDVKLDTPHSRQPLPDTDAQAQDARAVCDRLGIPHYSLDLTDAFTEYVVQPFMAGYLCGETPNPCITCNRHIKFDLLWQKMLELDFDVLVTGHYARCLPVSEEGKGEQVPMGKDPLGRNSEYGIFRSLSTDKDQSYVLWPLQRERLARMRFPLGELQKSEVREIARQNGLGLVVAEKPESQDICFIPHGDHAAFIEHFANLRPADLEGPIIDSDGNTLGQHQGLYRYTIGQRKGLGVAVGEPLYVYDIDSADNTLRVGRDEALYRDSVSLRELNLLAELPINQGIAIQAQYRYASSAHPATLYIEDTVSGFQARVHFDEPQKAISPGQSLVCYQGERVVAGGVIDKRYSEFYSI